MPDSNVRLTPGRRVLFLTRDPETVRRQLRGELDLQMKDVDPSDLMDDINTDAMAPAWACFDYRPEALAPSAYAGITVDGERLFGDNALIDGNFEVIVSGKRKGVGSSREQAVQAEKYAEIRIAIADGFAPIHARNNINSGVLMAGHDVLIRLQAGEEVPLESFMTGRDPVTRLIIRAGGLFAFTRAVARGEAQLPLPTTEARPMTEKILLSRIAVEPRPAALKPGDAIAVKVDGGFSHDFTSAQVHYFLTEEYGEGYRLKNPSKFAVFEDQSQLPESFRSGCPVSRLAPDGRRVGGHKPDRRLRPENVQRGSRMNILEQPVDRGGDPRRGPSRPPPGPAGRSAKIHTWRGPIRFR